MGIDVYARWKGQTADERKQMEDAWLSIEGGHAGYLREAYHGEPYATQYLVREAFESETDRARIPAAVLRERLARTLALAAERERTVYGTTGDITTEHPALKSFSDFVELCERKERETGEPVTIVVWA